MSYKKNETMNGGCCKRCKGEPNNQVGMVASWRFTDARANRHKRAIQPGGKRMEQTTQKEVFTGPWALPIVTGQTMRKRF